MIYNFNLMIVLVTNKLIMRSKLKIALFAWIDHDWSVNHLIEIEKYYWNFWSRQKNEFQSQDRYFDLMKNGKFDLMIILPFC
jgi:hypothetical protein